MFPASEGETKMAARDEWFDERKVMIRDRTAAQQINFYPREGAAGFG